jgi:hypothetical protein
MRTLKLIVLLNVLSIPFFGCSNGEQSIGKTEVKISQIEIISNGTEAERKQVDRNIQKAIFDDSSNIKVPVSLFIDEKSRQINDTLVSLDYLKEMMTAITAINAPKLNIKFPKEYYFAILYNDTIRIEIEKEEFDTTGKVMTYEKGTGGYSFLTKINGKPYWGTDGSFIPNYEIKTFKIIINDEEIAIDEDMYNNLYNPNLFCQEFSQKTACSVNAYVLPTGEILIIMENSEAAASYYPLWVIKGKKIVKRLIAEGT